LIFSFFTFGFFYTQVRIVRNGRYALAGLYQMSQIKDKGRKAET
jgi:hypothetical protein